MMSSRGSCTRRSCALASVYNQHMATDISGSIGSQEDRGAFEIVICAKAARWDMTQQIVFLVLDDPVRHMRGKPSRRDRIDLNIMTRPLARQVFGKRNYPTLACMVSNGLH